MGAHQATIKSVPPGNMTPDLPKVVVDGNISLGNITNLLLTVVATTMGFFVLNLLWNKFSQSAKGDQGKVEALERLLEDKNKECKRKDTEIAELTSKNLALEQRVDDAIKTNKTQEEKHIELFNSYATIEDDLNKCRNLNETLSVKLKTISQENKLLTEQRHTDVKKLEFEWKEANENWESLLAIEKAAKELLTSELEDHKIVSQQLNQHVEYVTSVIEALKVQLNEKDCEIHKLLELLSADH